MPRKGTLAIVIPNNPAILGYAAGLLDGEGSIWISKTMRKPYAVVALGILAASLATHARAADAE